jgi:hypothetical protein
LIYATDRYWLYGIKKEVDGTPLPRQPLSIEGEKINT